MDNAEAGISQRAPPRFTVWRESPQPRSRNATAACALRSWPAGAAPPPLCQAFVPPRPKRRPRGRAQAASSQVPPPGLAGLVPTRALRRDITTGDLAACLRSLIGAPTPQEPLPALTIARVIRRSEIVQAYAHSERLQLPHQMPMHAFLASRTGPADDATRIFHRRLSQGAWPWGRQSPPVASEHRQRPKRLPCNNACWLVPPPSACGPRRPALTGPLACGRYGRATDVCVCVCVSD